MKAASFGTTEYIFTSLNMPLFIDTSAQKRRVQAITAINHKAVFVQLTLKLKISSSNPVSNVFRQIFQYFYLTQACVSLMLQLCYNYGQTRLSLHGSTWNLVCVIAVVSGTRMVVSINR